MKRLLIFSILLVLVLSSVGCSSPASNEKSEEELKEEIKADMEADEKLKEPEDKVSKYKDVHDLDSVFEFVNSNYPNYTREDFDMWIPNYFDLTQNGSDEVVFTTTYFDGKLESAIVITVEEGEFIEIPSFIPFAKYENNVSFEDGFLVHRSKWGGSGAYYYDMDLYVYDGYRLVDTIDGTIKIKEEVAAPNTSYNVTSKINGNFKDFVITLTKFDDINEKEEVISKDHYVYDIDGKFFWKKPISLSNTANGFEKVYNGKNLKETIEYFYNNLYHFDENRIKDFSIKMIKEIEKDRDKIYPMNDSILYYISNESFDFETNELDISDFDDDTKKMIDYINNSEIYRLAKYFYAMEGEITDEGFCVTIDPWIFEMLKPALNFAYPKRYTPYDYTGLEPFFAPNIYFYKAKQVELTQIVYPNVYVNSYDDVKKLEGAKTWKTKLIMPVEIIEK